MRDAKAGALDHWTGTPHGTLALIILLERFSRNLHRGSPEAFAADTQARTIARTAVAKGFDHMLGPIERIFVYLPFEHSEDLTDQNESVRLFETMRGTLGAETIDYAHRHRDAIGLRSIPASKRGAWPCQHVCGGGLSRRAGCRFLTVPHTRLVRLASCA